MEIYLPIAELSMNVFLLLGLGAAAGLLSGMFGVGGGFLATPLLIFVGIPPAVAVASQANQVVANSISFVVALGLFIATTKAPNSTRRSGRVVFRAVAGIVLVSIPIGLGLAWSRHP